MSPFICQWESRDIWALVPVASKITAFLLQSNVSNEKLFSCWPPTASSTSQNVFPCWRSHRRPRGKLHFPCNFGLKKCCQFQNYNSGKVLLWIGSFHFCSLPSFLLSKWQQETVKQKRKGEGKDCHHSPLDRTRKEKHQYVIQHSQGRGGAKGGALHTSLIHHCKATILYWHSWK